MLLKSFPGPLSHTARLWNKECLVKIPLRYQTIGKREKVFRRTRCPPEPIFQVSISVISCHKISLCHSVSFRDFASSWISQLLQKGNYFASAKLMISWSVTGVSIILSSEVRNEIALLKWILGSVNRLPGLSETSVNSRANAWDPSWLPNVDSCRVTGFSTLGCLYS